MLEVFESILAQVIVLSSEGEIWFKDKPTERHKCNLFLKPEFQNDDLSKGILQSWLKDEWLKPLIILQNILPTKGDMLLRSYTILDFCYILNLDCN